MAVEQSSPSCIPFPLPGVATGSLVTAVETHILSEWARKLVMLVMLLSSVQLEVIGASAHMQFDMRWYLQVGPSETALPSVMSWRALTWTRLASRSCWRGFRLPPCAPESLSLASMPLSLESTGLTRSANPGTRCADAHQDSPLDRTIWTRSSTT